MIASKKLRARTVLASIPQGVLPMAKTVLVVDDNALIRQALCEMFKREADFEVCGEAENGREAIEKAQQLHPDLIVMDLSMPVMNGIEAASILKSLMPTVPLIIFSEYSDVFFEKEARSAGVSALVSKSEHRVCSGWQSSRFALPHCRLILTSFPNQETQDCPS